MFDTLKKIITNHIRYRRQVIGLAKCDLQKDYSGTNLGWMWAFVRPAIRLGVYYFTFTVGLRTGAPVNGFPYFLWFMSGLIPYFYLGSKFSGGAGCLRKNKYLVTKINFPIDLIPTFSNLATLFLQVVMVVIMLLVFVLMGYPPTVYWLQLPIYIFFMFMISTVWCLFTGVLGTLSKDFCMAIKSVSGVMFWVSGVFFKIDNINMPAVKSVFLLNPMALIIRGYRNSMINQIWFWENNEIRTLVIAYFILLFLACFVYRKFYKELPDVI